MKIRILGKGKSSLGQALLRSRKLTQRRICPFFFFIGTTFANQSGCFSVRINLAANNCSTYALISISSSGLNFLAACFTGVKFGPLWSKGVWVVSIHLRERVRMRSPTKNPPELTADVRVPRKYGKREKTAPKKIINFLLFETVRASNRERPVCHKVLGGARPPRLDRLPKHT